MGTGQKVGPVGSDLGGERLGPVAGGNLELLLVGGLTLAASLTSTQLPEQLGLSLEIRHVRHYTDTVGAITEEPPR